MECGIVRIIEISPRKSGIDNKSGEIALAVMFVCTLGELTVGFASRCRHLIKCDIATALPFSNDNTAKFAFL